MMKKVIFILVLISVTALSLGCRSTGKVSLKNREDSLSYALGLQVGQALEKGLTKVDYRMFIRAMKDAADTSKIALSNEQIQIILNTYQVETQLKMQKKREEDSKKNKEDQTKFLAENAKKPGIMSLEGIQYKVLQEGTGEKIQGKDRFEVEFIGRTFDGKEFMNSKEAPEPIIVSLEEVFPGWQIALKNMKVGSKWEIYLPDSLAFGEHGAGEVGPNQGVIFELLLKKIAK